MVYQGVSSAVWHESPWKTLCPWSHGRPKRGVPKYALRFSCGHTMITGLYWRAHLSLLWFISSVPTIGMVWEPCLEMLRVYSLLCTHGSFLVVLGCHMQCQRAAEPKFAVCKANVLPFVLSLRPHKSCLYIFLNKVSKEL